MSEEIQKQEDRIQQEIFTWYQNNYCLNHHIPQCMIFHVPNQGQQHLVRIGVLPGVSDLIVIHATPSHPIGVHIYFEVKTPTGTQSPAQKKFQARITALGYEYHIVRSCEEFWYIAQEINRRLSTT